MSDRPNLLFIYTDEQRADTLAAYGNTRIRMPNLDRLASQSTVFRNAYVTQPVCTPSRASLLTGLYPHTHKCVTNNIALRPETRCLPELLADPNYLCAHQGKWHLGDEIYAQHGFTEWVATEDTYHAHYAPPHQEFADRSAYHHWLLARDVRPVDLNSRLPPARRHPAYENRFFRDQIHRLPEETARPTFLAETASEFIRRNRNRPFVLYVNYLEPHMPFHSCRDAQYGPDDVEIPANARHVLGESFNLRARIHAAQYLNQGYEGQGLGTEDEWRRLIARYWGMCGLVDSSIGRILATLQDCRLNDRTLVVFTSDHGDMMGSHGLLGKGCQFEEAVKVPLLIRLPGQTEGRTVTCPVSQVDVVPTLLDLMNVATSDSLQGQSLRPILSGKPDRTGRDVFIEWNADGERVKTFPDYLRDICSNDEANHALRENVRTVITPEGWKFNWSSVGNHELFNLTGDPLEQTNLARSREFRGMIRRLATRIRNWQARTADGLVLPDPAP